jgi:hypothetical protein
MKIIRRRVRATYLWGAICFVGIVVIGAGHPEAAATHPVAFYLVLSASALLAVLYGAAWYTTRKPSTYRNNWAVAASSLSLIWAVVMAYAIYQRFPDNPRAEIPAVIAILVSCGGLYLYAPGGSPSKPESAIASIAPAKSEATFPVPQPPVHRIFSAPTPIAPSLAAPSASSPEIAAAAAGAAGPNAPWDPLQFLRSPETLEKLRS